MGRKPIEKHLRKETITIKLPKWVIDAIRTKPNYNPMIEQLIIKKLYEEGITVNDFVNKVDGEFK